MSLIKLVTLWVAYSKSIDVAVFIEGIGLPIILVIFNIKLTSRGYNIVSTSMLIILLILNMKYCGVYNKLHIYNSFYMIVLLYDWIYFIVLYTIISILGILIRINLRE